MARETNSGGCIWRLITIEESVGAKEHVSKSCPSFIGGVFFLRVFPGRILGVVCEKDESKFALLIRWSASKDAKVDRIDPLPGGGNIPRGGSDFVSGIVDERAVHGEELLSRCRCPGALGCVDVGIWIIELPEIGIEVESADPAVDRAVVVLGVGNLE